MPFLGEPTATGIAALLASRALGSVREAVQNALGRNPNAATALPVSEACKNALSAILGLRTALLKYSKFDDILIWCETEQAMDPARVGERLRQIDPDSPAIDSRARTVQEAEFRGLEEWLRAIKYADSADAAVKSLTHLKDYLVLLGTNQLTQHLLKSGPVSDAGFCRLQDAASRALTVYMDYCLTPSVSSRSQYRP